MLFYLFPSVASLWSILFLPDLPSSKFSSLLELDISPYSPMFCPPFFQLTPRIEFFSPFTCSPLSFLASHVVSSASVPCSPLSSLTSNISFSASVQMCTAILIDFAHHFLLVGRRHFIPFNNLTPLSCLMCYEFPTDRKNLKFVLHHNLRQFDDFFSTSAGFELLGIHPILSNSPSSYDFQVAKMSI